MNMGAGVAMPSAYLTVFAVLRMGFIAIFLVMMVLYALRLLGILRSEHHDTMTDAAHFIMALAMFCMFAWPSLFM